MAGNRGGTEMTLKEAIDWCRSASWDAYADAVERANAYDDAGAEEAHNFRKKLSEIADFLEGLEQQQKEEIRYVHEQYRKSCESLRARSDSLERAYNEILHYVTEQKALEVPKLIIQAPVEKVLELLNKEQQQNLAQELRESSVDMLE